MIVVTTPTGMIGQQVLSMLLEGGEPLRVIARDASRLPAATRDRVEVVEGSIDDPTVLGHAFSGADAVFWLPPPNPRATSLAAVFDDFTRPACAAVREQGVQHVVGVSAIGRGTPVADHAGNVTASLRMDDLIAQSGVHYRALAMPSFMDNLLRQVELIKTQGLFTMPIDGDRKLPTCATRDIAAAAARLLLDRSWSGVASMPVLGPEDLSFDEMAAIMTAVLGKPVRFQQIGIDAFKTRLTGFGMSEAMANGMAEMMVAKNSGLDNGELRTPQSSSPTTFRQWCEDVLKPKVVA